MSVYRVWQLDIWTFVYMDVHFSFGSHPEQLLSDRSTLGVYCEVDQVCNQRVEMVRTVKDTTHTHAWSCIPGGHSGSKLFTSSRDVPGLELLYTTRTPFMFPRYLSNSSVKDFVDEHTTTVAPLEQSLYLLDCRCYQRSSANNHRVLSHVVMIAFLLLGLMYLLINGAQLRRFEVVDDIAYEGCV
jgi:hypothetical protein